MPITLQRTMEGRRGNLQKRMIPLESVRGATGHNSFPSCNWWVKARNWIRLQRCGLPICQGLTNINMFCNIRSQIATVQLEWAQSISKGTVFFGLSVPWSVLSYLRTFWPIWKSKLICFCYWKEMHHWPISLSMEELYANLQDEECWETYLKRIQVL